MKVKLFAGFVFLALMAAMAYGMGLYRSHRGTIACSTAVAANHRDSGTVYMLAGMENYKTIIARVKIWAPDSAAWPATHTPVLGQDTGSIRLVTYMGNRRFYLDSMAAKAVLPCSLLYARTNSTTGNDTIMKSVLAFEYQIADSLSDTAINYIVNYDWEVIAKE